MFPQLSARTKGILALIFLAIVYASAGAVIRYLSYSFGVFQQIYLRMFIGLVLGLLLFRRIDYSKLAKISGKEWLLLLTRALGNTLAASLWVYATPITKLANIGFIDSLPLTAVLSFVFAIEKFSAKKIFWVLLSFAGVFILSVKNLSGISSFGLGELLVFVSGFFFAFRNITRRWHSKLLNDQEISQIMNIIGIIILFIISLLSGEKIGLPPMDLLLVLMLLYGGFIMFVNIFLTNYGFSVVPAVLGNNILNLEAFFAILVGFFFYGEVPAVKELIGGALIVISVIKMNQLK